MGLLFQLIASGSKGNALLVSSPGTRLLVDAGLTGKELARRMDRTSVKARELQGILVSHEHSDHVRGAGVLSRRFDLPVYMNQGTLENLPPWVGRLENLVMFQTGRPFRIGDLTVHSFSTSHDAGEPVGFVIEHDGSRLGICTDLGVATHLVKQRLQGCRGLVLEANHDPRLLMNGPYPPRLKQRIGSRQGHLSNLDARGLLGEVDHQDLRAVMLAHLSEINNDPLLVRDVFRLWKEENRREEVRFHMGLQAKESEAVEI